MREVLMLKGKNVQEMAVLLSRLVMAGVRNLCKQNVYYYREGQ
jgi:hypothetical protein